MWKFKNNLAAFLVVLFASNLLAQNDSTKSFPVNIGADVVSSYIWRGYQLLEGVNVQPVISYEKSGFTGGVWGSYSFTSTISEFDVFASYTYKNFTLGVVDYFFLENENYFNYKKDETEHKFEAFFEFKGSERFPIKLLVSTIFYGNDVNVNGDNYYSTYLELAYKLKTTQMDFNFFLGGVVNDNTFYLNDKGIVNVGLRVDKSVKLSEKYALPLYLSVSMNPTRETAFILFGLTL